MFTFPLNDKARIQCVCNHADGKVNPIFSNVLINASASSGSITFSASNGAQHNSFTLNAAVEEDCQFTLDAGRLATVLGALNGDSVKFISKDDHVVARSGKSRLKLETGEAVDYPEPPTIEQALTTVSCTVADLGGLFSYASYAVAKKDVRYYLNYLNMTVNDDDQSLIVCATDGHRLSQLRHSLRCTGNGSYLVPLSMFTALLAQGLNPDTPVTIKIHESMICAQCPDTMIISTLGDGMYPDVKRVIPAKGANFVTLKLNEFKSLVKRLHSVAALEKYSSLRLEIDATTVNVSVASSGNNAFSEEMDAEVHCEPVTLGLNASYLADALARQSGDYVRIYPNGNAAVLLCCDVDELTTLIMPTRV
ncbi:DNA polymerase III subunit beta [Shewanella colwelliana]|uniref:Beta sliding clamp n=1 Tax=Shewanella colwelliana TaxID=23 RepID=A0ABQ4P0E6_SHECO|nr:DNA polymerase III subunit beta [Shewanella colwelliana]GIU40973.1 DNA polymerase III subunit beta [Shewanella colwelliana]